MDKAHRRELKHDKFVEQVGHSVEYAGEHKDQVMKIGGAILLLMVAALGWYFYSNSQHSTRQAALREALRIQEAQIGATSSDLVLTYPTQDAKNKAMQKAFTDVANSYPNRPEGLVAKYYLAIASADEGKLPEAEKYFKEVAESGEDEYASQAKLSLAQIYGSTGRIAEAERLLRSVIDDPTILVSKEQATIALARLLASSKPAEARKLLEPLRTERSAVSRAAITALSDIK